MANIKSILRHIPNFITVLNLLFGCFAIVYSFRGELETAYVLILIAAIFDFLDGLAARFLKAYSEYGKVLDSLSDNVSFGFAPASIMYNLLLRAIEKDNHFLGIAIQGFYLEQIILFSAFLIAVFSSLRLAKFHVDSRQSESFIGLATPANTILIASLACLLVNPQEQFLYNNLLSLNFLIPFILIQSFLLVSEIPMFSMKIKSFALKDNKIRYLHLFISVVLLVFFFHYAVPLIFLLYILFSLIFWKSKMS